MRNIAAGMLAEISKPVIRTAWFARLTLADGSLLNLWTGYDYKSWEVPGEGSPTSWSPLGILADVSNIPESAEMKAEGITLTLDGIPSAVISDVQNLRRGLPAIVWFAFLDIAENIIADPYKCWSGFTDVPSVDESGETCSVSITVENPMRRLQKAQFYRYTDEDQQYFYPGDRGCEYVAQLQNSTLNWGSGAGIPGLQPTQGVKPGNAP